MDIPSTFKDIAPFLQHPLVLTGFVVLLFFGILTGLLKAKILPQLPQKAAGDIVKRIINYGFIIALLIITLGFWEHLNEHDTRGRSDGGVIAPDTTVSRPRDSLLAVHHSTDGDHRPDKKVYCMVTPYVPSEYNDAEIRVDGRPADVVDRTPMTVTVRVAKSEKAQEIVLRSKGGGECTTSVLVDGDKQLRPCL